MGFSKILDCIGDGVTYKSNTTAVLNPHEINAYINKGFETIYNVEPVANNYFVISKVYDPFASTDTTIDKDDDYSSLFRRYCQSISFSDNLGIQLNTDNFKSKGQNYYSISGVGRSQTVKIEYIEDSSRTMFHIHKNWVDSWFNGGYNCFACGRRVKFRNMEIQFFRMTPEGPKVYAIAELKNMVPSDIGHIFDANYSQPGNDTKYTVTYSVDGVNFKFTLDDSDDTLSSIQNGTVWRKYGENQLDKFRWKDDAAEKNGTLSVETGAANYTGPRRY